MVLSHALCGSFSPCGGCVAVAFTACSGEPAHERTRASGLYWRRRQHTDGNIELISISASSEHLSWIVGLVRPRPHTVRDGSTTLPPSFLALCGRRWVVTTTTLWIDGTDSNSQWRIHMPTPPIDLPHPPFLTPTLHSHNQASLPSPSIPSEGSECKYIAKVVAVRPQRAYQTDRHGKRKTQERGTNVDELHLFRRHGLPLELGG